mmetsp:Transcript_33391/g.70156  ORF Transcript_33391/g.70156 Transcript_33391/m.70156 type:complete len:100 (+) Transcript_33391:300-599(+)
MPYLPIRNCSRLRAITFALCQRQDDEEEEEGGSSSRDLEYVRTFVERKVLRPIRWLGRHEDWEIVAMERGSIGVRILYKLSDIPDLKDRDAGGDESVLF